MGRGVQGSRARADIESVGNLVYKFLRTRRAACPRSKGRKENDIGT